MNIWHDISEERIQPENFSVLIEIPKGSNCKYELDKQTGMLRLDRAETIEIIERAIEDYEKLIAPNI